MGQIALMKRWILRCRLYWLAACLFDLYRLIAKPRTRGALVALWCQGRVLLVVASYRRELSLPGGWINRGEAPEHAAQRELEEELGVVAPLEQFQKPWVCTERSAGGTNTVWFYGLSFAAEPAVRVDELEILSVIWATPTEALQMPITGHLREYLLHQLKLNADEDDANRVRC